ncbi:MAG: hypothetical protein WC055_01040 [Melioribacteraceae bacterium]
MELEWVGVSLVCFFVACLLIPSARHKDEKIIAFVIGGPLMWGWFLVFFCLGVVEGVRSKSDIEE